MSATTVKNAKHYSEIPPRITGTTTEHSVIDDRDGAGLALAVLSIAEDPAATTAAPTRAVPNGWDEILYVVDGSGVLTTAHGSHTLSPGISVRVNGAAEPGATTEYRIIATGPDLLIAATLGRATPESTVPDAISAHLDSEAQNWEDAVSGREFQVLFDAESGCSGMTAFLGYVPAIRTKRHIHPYSEVIFIVSGSATIDIDGEITDVSKGWCYYLPAGVPHVVDNRDENVRLVELGVFTPSGSPANNTPVE